MDESTAKHCANAAASAIIHNTLESHGGSLAFVGSVCPELDDAERIAVADALDTLNAKLRESDVQASAYMTEKAAVAGALDALNAVLGESAAAATASLPEK